MPEATHDAPLAPATQPIAESEPAPSEAHLLLVEAAQLWSDTCGYFGDPQEMFRHPFMRQRSRSIAQDWIRCLEMLVRRIILIAALKLNLAPPAPRASTGQGGTPKPPRGPFKALRPTLVIVPRVTRRHRHRSVMNPSPISQLRMHTLARRLTAIRDAITNAHLYARRTAFSLAQMARRNGNRPHPLIALKPWLIREEKRTSGQATMYEPIARAQGICEEELELWHARLLEPG